MAHLIAIILFVFLFTCLFGTFVYALVNRRKILTSEENLQPQLEPKSKL